MVPPIADNMSTNFAALSLVILSIVGVSKNLLTYLKSFFHSQIRAKVRYYKMLYKGNILTTSTVVRWNMSKFLIIIVSFRMREYISKLFFGCQFIKAGNK